MDIIVIFSMLLLAHASAWFLISFVKKRNDVADVAWGLGFLLFTWASFVLFYPAGLRGLLASLLVSVWSLRLAWHIAERHKGKPEDFRYAVWRNDWGKWFYLRSYVQIYLLQGFLSLVVVLPVLFINAGAGISVTWLDILGFLVWALGFYFEVVGDRELTHFIKNPANKGRLMQEGLWAWTRHPNYFGEVTQWWGLYLVALSVPWGWVSIVGPATITFLILKVSGIPMLEKKMAENPEFLSYKERVSVFIPLPPRKPKSL